MTVSTSIHNYTTMHKLSTSFFFFSRVRARSLDQSPINRSPIFVQRKNYWKNFIHSNCSIPNLGHIWGQWCLPKRRASCMSTVVGTSFFFENKWNYDHGSLVRTFIFQTCSNSCRNRIIPYTVERRSYFVILIPANVVVYCTISYFIVQTRDWSCKTLINSCKHEVMSNYYWGNLVRMPSQNSYKCRRNLYTS